MLQFHNSGQRVKKYKQVMSDLFSMSAWNTPVHSNAYSHPQIIYDFKVRRFQTVGMAALTFFVCAVYSIQGL